MTLPTEKLEQTAGGLRCAAVSDVGMRRANNQDSLAIALADSVERWNSHGHLLVVADGMGAHAAGELASKLATDTIPHSYFKRTGTSPSEAIVEAVREANDTIHAKGENSVDFRGMGTTCSCLVLLPQGALAAHVGDSRVYRLRDNRFEQLTFDHSLVWEMAEAGNASEEDVPAYVPKNVITRSLGPHPTVAVDVEGPFPLKTGDRFLLCSDGLTGPLSPELIGMVLASLPPSQVAQSLVDLANLLGGPDNITVVIAEVVDVGQLGTAGSAQPLDAGRASSGKASNPVVWVAMGLFALLAIGSAAMGQIVPAVLGGVGFLGVAIYAFLNRPRCIPCEMEQNSSGHRDKAPYRCHDSAPSAANIEKISSIVRQLEELESGRDWDFDWKPIHRHRQEAQDAITAGNYPEAVAAFCCAVRTMMELLRNSTADKASDSSIDLA